MKRATKPKPRSKSVADTGKPAASKPRNQSRFHVEFKNSPQKLAWAGFQQHDILFLCGPAGVGKTFLAMAFAIEEVLQGRKKKIVLTRPIVEAGENLGFLPGPQPLDAKILTPNGWTTMGELKVDDMVIGRDGKPTKVLGIYPKGKKMAYKVSTTEGTATECCEDHLWLTTTSEDRKRGRCGSVKSTKEIMESLLNKNSKINHHIPRNEPIEFAKQNLPMRPYSIGVFLGDGCMSDENAAISMASIDPDILDRVNKELSDFGCDLIQIGETISYFVNANLKTKKTAQKMRSTNIITGEINEYNCTCEAAEILDIKNKCLYHRCRNNLTIDNVKYEFLSLENRWSHPIKVVFDNLKILGKKANEKFIPDIYKYSSINDRIDLLRGLMDTDGTVKKTGEASFCTTSKQLALDVIELVQSLGGRATLRSRNRVGKFSLLNERIITTKNISYEFTISLPHDINPFHLKRKSERFSAKYIHGVGIKSISPIGEKEVQCILVENPEHLYVTDQYIVTHNTFEEKVNPYMMPLYDSIERLVGNNNPQRDMINAAIDVRPLAYMRGATFHDAVCIFDEAQNATLMQLKLFMTRFGENSKQIITGDPSQSDLVGRYVALVDVMDRLENIPGIGMIKFKSDSIVRHPLVGAIVDRLGEPIQ